MSPLLPTVLDHAFVVLVLGLIFPLAGLWSYRRFLARLKTRGGAALLEEYRQTLWWLFGLGAGTAAIWAATGREWEALGLRPIELVPGYGWALGIACGASVGLLGRPLFILKSEGFASAARQQMGDLAAFLPKTKRQLVWSFAVSVGAGTMEELAYRGFLMSYLAAWLPLWAVIAVSSAIFGVAHIYQGAVGTLTTAILGAVFALLYIATGSLVLPMLLHTLADISAMLGGWLLLRERSSV